MQLKKDVAAFMVSLDKWREEEERYLTPLYTTADRSAPPSRSGVVASAEEVVLPQIPLSPSSRKRKRTAAGQKRRGAHSEAWLEINSIHIDLPSSHDPHSRAHASLADAIRIETQLRQGQANDALDDLRAHLVTSYTFHQQRKKATGQKAKTREDWRIKHKRQAIARAAETYRRVRVALVDLGLDARILKEDYRVLKKADVQPFVVFIDKEKPGYSKKPHSWIWGDLAFVDKTKDIEDYVAESKPSVNVTESIHSFLAVRVFWFRSSALHRRWTEEVFLLREEMRRTVRYFKWHRAEWNSRASAEEANAREGYAAYYRK